MLGKLVVKPIVKPKECKLTSNILKLGRICCKKSDAYAKLGSVIAYELWLSQQPRLEKREQGAPVDLVVIYCGPKV
jgi:hypothetical protein